MIYQTMHYKVDRWEYFASSPPFALCIYYVLTFPGLHVLILILHSLYHLHTVSTNSFNHFSCFGFPLMVTTLCEIVCVENPTAIEKELKDHRATKRTAAISYLRKSFYIDFASSLPFAFRV